MSTAAEAWLARLHQRGRSPPRRARLDLCWRGLRIGSLEPELPPLLQLSMLQPCSHAGAPAWEVAGDLTAGLARIARKMADMGLLGAWRDEQLAVRDAQGTVHGTVERAAVRPLGIATLAVHLVGMTADGRHWVQQRAFDKPNDRGLWDTLVGGMVPARDTVEAALERETWEEAGLRLGRLRDLQHGGRVGTARPGTEVATGYVVEQLDWYRCTVPDGVQPHNQDGEVERFSLMETDEVRSRMLRDEFTIDAALVLADAGLWQA